jgi:hypothetical protein
MFTSPSLILLKLNLLESNGVLTCSNGYGIRRFSLRLGFNYPTRGYDNRKDE